MSENEDRIHPATPARQQQVWRDGDFAKSYELAASIQILGGLAIAACLFGSLAVWLKKNFLAAYSAPLVSTQQAAGAVEQMQSILYSALPVLGSIGALIVLLGIASHWCQTGVVVLGNRLSPDIHRLSPRHWLTRVFSHSGLVFTLMSVPKILLSLVVMLAGCWVVRDSFLQLGTLPVDQIGGQVLQLALIVCGQVALVLLISSGLDYWMKYLSYQTRIRMSDQELRDEEKMQSRKTPPRRKLNSSAKLPE